MAKSPLLLLLLVSSICLSTCYPLSTQNKWITDDSTGRRAKFACVNWAGHLEPMIPEGLHKQPLKHIVAHIPRHNFNCVRLTYAIHMWTRYANETVANTLVNLDLPDALQGIQKNNPSFLNMTHVQVLEAVVHELGAQKVRVLLDNHVSKPKWCCNDDDDNGYFHDRHFDPQEWIQGLTLAATHFAGNPAVVAMSLRNELHGPRQNLGDWYMYMSQGGRAIHKANPQVLVVVSGLNYDTELQFLRTKPLKLDIGNKLVFETHLYSWSGIGTLKLRGIWSIQPLNRICAQSVKGIDYRAGFVTTGQNAVPLIFTEFGFDQTGASEEDLKFLTCIQTYLAGRDMDWGLWTLQGTYYVREDMNQLDVEDTFGVLDSSWNQLRNPNITQTLQLLQMTNQDPSSKLRQHSILYHPLSGHCVNVNDEDEVELGSCESKTRWHHAKNGNQILLVGTNKCLSASGKGLPVLVSDQNCKSHKSSWKSLSLSKLHLGIEHEDHHLCLQKDSNTSALFSANCVCIDDHDSLCLDDPRSQWFQLVPTNI